MTSSDPIPWKIKEIAGGKNAKSERKKDSSNTVGLTGPKDFPATGRRPINSQSTSMNENISKLKIQLKRVETIARVSKIIPISKGERCSILSAACNKVSKRFPLRPGKFLWLVGVLDDNVFPYATIVRNFLIFYNDDGLQDCISSFAEWIKKSCRSL